MVKVGKLTRMVEGDHSIFMMINGLMSLLALLFYTAFHLLNIRDAFLVGAARDRNEPIHSFGESLRHMGRRNFAYLVLAIPFVAVVFLTILPLVFSVLLAFTNYADPILPPAHLVEWVGFGNFNKMLSLDVWSSTFGGVLTWTLIWAIIATATTYIGGVLIAVLIHQPRVRWKKLWRTLLIVPFAIPNMISLLVMRNMFNNQFGPINSYVRALGLEGWPG